MNTSGSYAALRRNPARHGLGLGIAFPLEREGGRGNPGLELQGAGGFLRHARGEGIAGGCARSAQERVATDSARPVADARRKLALKRGSKRHVVRGLHLEKTFLALQSL